MNKKIIVKGKKESDILEITLNDILSLLENGWLYSWKILWIDINGIKYQKFNISEKLYSFTTLENEINNHNLNGLSISWEELIKLDSWVIQFTNLLIIGDKDNANLKRYGNDQAMIENCQYILEIIDASYWEIYSKDVKFTTDLLHYCSLVL